MSEGKNLTQLGSNTPLPSSPDKAILEKIDVIEPLMKQAVCRFSAPEFTSLCPVTGQPDFAHIYLDYVPNKYLLESKSLKLFLTSFRNHGAFHESCTVLIAKRIMEAIDPEWLRVTGIWFPRGGIPIDIFWQSGIQPQRVYVPQLKMFPYNGR